MKNPSTRGGAFLRPTCRMIKPLQKVTCSGVTEETTKQTLSWKKKKGHLHQMLTCAINITVHNSACCSYRHKAFKAVLKNMYTKWQEALIEQTVIPTSFNFSLGTRWLVYFCISVLNKTWINHRDHKQHFHLGACHQNTIRRRVTFTFSVAFLKGWEIS